MQRLVPSVFCIMLINFSFLYLVPAISAGFFVISHTPGYSNPRKAQLHLRVFALGSFQQSPLLYPFLQLYHVRRVDAEEDVQDFGMLGSGFYPFKVILLLLRAERVFQTLDSCSCLSTRCFQPSYAVEATSLSCPVHSFQTLTFKVKNELRESNIWCYLS